MQKSESSSSDNVKQVQAKYKDVPFEFLTAAEDAVSVLGTALVRDEAMVLEVDCPGDPRPYTIVGKAMGDYFVGVHEGITGDVTVKAQWTRLDDVYIGTWIEDDVEWLFKFALNNRQDED